jgi:fructose-bisphosphate aldolase class 1
MTKSNKGVAFVDTYTKTQVKDIVNEKVDMLYDFCALHRRGNYPDPREEIVREILTAKGTEDAMQKCIFGVIMFNETVDSMIRRYRKEGI